MLNARFATLLLLLGLSAACNQVKKLDRVGDNTNQMNNRMKGMVEDTGHLQADSATVYTRDSRVKSFETALRDKSFEGKASSLGVYVRSFELQAWKAKSGIPVRDRMFDDAVHEFIMSLPNSDRPQLIDNDLTDNFGDLLVSYLSGLVTPWARGLLRPLNINPGDVNDQMVYFALSSVLHLYNDQQLDQVRLYNRSHPSQPTKVYSMEDLIREALLAAKDQRDGKISWNDLAPWQKRALGFETSLVQLMRARTVTLATTSLIYLGRFPYEGQLKSGLKLTLKNDFFQKILTLGKGSQKWKINYDENSIGELAFKADWMERAVDVMRFTKKLGHPAKFSGISYHLLDGVQTQYVPKGKFYTDKDRVILKFENNVKNLKAELGMRVN